MSLHVLVTGGAGFLGQALCASLVAQGLRVTAMVRRPEVALPNGVTRWVAPELPSLAEDAVQRLSTIDVVVHAAGRAHVLIDQGEDSMAAFRQVNAEGTLALARTAAEAGVARFIFVSSVGVNGSQSGYRPFAAEDRPQPDTPYAQSKWEAEQALNLLRATTGIDVLHVRPPMIYGPAAPGNFALLARLVAKGWPLPFGAMNAPRSFVALDNVVDLLTHMVQHPNPPSGVYLVADGQVTTTTQFIRAMAQGMGQSLSLIPLPVTWLQAVMGWVGRGEQIRKMSVPLALDIRATVARLSWTPPLTMEVAMKRAFSAPQNLISFEEPKS